MNIFSFLSRSPEKQIARLQKKVKEPHGEASVRVNAAYKLHEMGTPEAMGALLQRFTITVSPSVQDEDEKEQVLAWVVSYGQDAVDILTAFLKRERQVYWPFRALREILSDQELIEKCNELLRYHWEHPPATVEPQTQLIRALHGLHSQELEETIRLFLDERDDDIVIATLDYLFELENEDSRVAVLESYLDAEDRPRVRAHILERLCQEGWNVKGYRPRIEESLPPGYTLTRDGKVKVLSREP
jgi:hypothetical protein